MKKRTVKLSVVIDGQEPIGFVTSKRNVSAALRRMASERNSEWMVVEYTFIRDCDGLLMSGTIYRWNQR